MCSFGKQSVGSMFSVSMFCSICLFNVCVFVFCFNVFCFLSNVFAMQNKNHPISRAPATSPEENTRSHAPHPPRKKEKARRQGAGIRMHEKGTRTLRLVNGGVVQPFFGVEEAKNGSNGCNMEISFIRSPEGGRPFFAENFSKPKVTHWSLSLRQAPGSSDLIKIQPAAGMPRHAFRL